MREFALRRFGLEKSGVLRQIVRRLEVTTAGLHQALEPRILTRHLLGSGRILKELGIAQSGFDLAQAAGEFFDVRAEIHPRPKSNPPAKAAAWAGGMRKGA